MELRTAYKESSVVQGRWPDIYVKVDRVVTSRLERSRVMAQKVRLVTPSIGILGLLRDL